LDQTRRKKLIHATGIRNGNQQKLKATGTGNADDEKLTTGRKSATTVESICDRGRGRNNYIKP